MFKIHVNHIFFITIISHVYIFCGCNPLFGVDVREAEPNEFDFVVSLSLKKGNNELGDEVNHFCGGVLISQQHVLTSAHCKKLAKTKGNVVVKIGSNDLINSEKYEIDQWITFAEYKKSQKVKVPFLDEDISVIRLKESVDPSIKPAKIAKFDSKNDLAGESVVTAGWGSTDKIEYPKKMVTATLKIISYEECIRNMNAVDKYHEEHYLNVGQICTTAYPYAVLGCGDSGSPLLINGTEVIAINDSTCPVQGRQYVSLEQNIHLRVDHYAFFINHVVNNEKVYSRASFRSKWLCWHRQHKG